MRRSEKKSKGQILVIFAISLFVLLFFVGLALDAGSVYVTYGHLKRAVDSASIAAANEFKKNPDIGSMTAAASEVFKLLNTDYLSVQVLICDQDNDGIRDSGLPPIFEGRCPDTANGEKPRKLVWVQAQQDAPLYFLSLMGFNNLTLTTNSISEAAPLDIVIVLDTSESMADHTSPDDDRIKKNADLLKYFSSPYNVPTYSPYFPYDPGLCNQYNVCQPMLDAKEAAKTLIDSLAPGYDQVAVVTYDSDAFSEYPLGFDLNAAKAAIDGIHVHDDTPVVFNVWNDWVYHAGIYNPINSEDLDGDGFDRDNFVTLYGKNCPFETDPADDPWFLEDRWWGVDDHHINGDGSQGIDPRYTNSKYHAPDPFGWGGVPCDRDDLYDSLDWNGDAVWTIDDHNLAIQHAESAAIQHLDAGVSSKHKDYLGQPGRNEHEYQFTGLSTCIGCGVRAGTNELTGGGRFGSVWVMVFLSDGAANLSDTRITNPSIPLSMKFGFCGGSMGQSFWTDYCFDNNHSPRYCIDSNPNTCPPGAISTNSSPPYSVLDYAMDMVDQAALTKSTNPLERMGNDIAIYTIRLGSMTIGSAEYFLRYMAAVGTDGDRDDPCLTAAPNETCGQYYFAPSGGHLQRVFEDIASRIYTRITQ